MSMAQLVDITKCGIGAVAVAGASSVSLGDTPRRVASMDAGGRTHARDTVLTEIKARIQAQDPLSVPLVLALVGAQTLVAGGRVVNEGTYQDGTLLRSVLHGFSLEIADQAAGTCSYDLQNRADAASTELADELSWAAGTLQAIRTRANTIRILSTAAFTDDAAAELVLPGIERLSYRASNPPQVASSNQATSNRWNLADIVDVNPQAWDISGSLVLRDMSLASAQTLAEQLAALRAGTLVLPCQVTGFDAGAAAPADKTITFQRLKFHSAGHRLNSKTEATAEISFDAVQVSAAGADLAIAAMLTIA